MKIRNQFYFIKNAFKGMTRNGEMTVTAIITVTSCLLLFGVFMLLSVNINQFSEQIRDDCQIQAYIVDTATSEQEQQVYNAISKMENVSECIFVSKSDAMEQYREYLGEDAVALDGLEGEDFLPSSVQINMHNLEQAQALAEEIKKIEYVQKVDNRQDVLNKVVDVTNAIKVGSLVAMAILLLVAIFIIANTIKLSVMSRKDEIHIMKYVGATAGFVRRPFIYEGIFTGIIGGVISLLITGFGYNAAVNFMDDFFTEIFDFIPLMEILPFMVATTLVFGVLMGAIGSFIALTKHLKV